MNSTKRNNWSRQSTAAELDINRTILYKKMRTYWTWVRQIEEAANDVTAWQGSPSRDRQAPGSSFPP